ncbi:integrase [Cerasibacillus terrae]|uniref:Integrase n=1 Tax=Cerasibacillus terrae TaxID=2498845 RepID=A0A5C8P2G3_9BACI|nr:tyrosine-type recombinase/integrase [Cerasibacillus terrae]TXL67477.1 integrase [Cerasibacillus terrae]
MLVQFQEDGMRGKSATTIKTYVYCLEQFDKWLVGSGTNIEEFSRSDVQQYIDYLAAKKKSASTINKIWNAIKKYCKFAGKEECMEEISIVKAPDYKKEAPEALSRNERNRLIREIDRTSNKRDFAILMVLLNTGVRVSELVSIDRSDIEMSERKGKLTVVGKGNKERSIPLNGEVRRAIDKYLHQRTDQHPALFLSNRGKRISVRTVQNLIHKYGYHVHQLRHTFITDLQRSGADLTLIQSLSGHSSLGMLSRYSMPTQEDKQKAVEILYKHE